MPTATTTQSAKAAETRPPDQNAPPLTERAPLARAEYPDAPPRRYGGIEGARGVAALLVFLYHSGAIEALGVERYVDPGKFGVVLFFFISGFLVLPSYAKHLNPTRFAIGRFFRLYPVYWASLLIALALMADWPSPANLAANATMFQQFLGFKNLQSVYWTLSIELLFYLSLVGAGLVAPVLLRERLGLSCVLLGVASVALGFLRMQTQMKLPLAAALGLFAMGCGAMLRRRHEAGEPLLRSWVAGLYSTCVVLACATGYSFSTKFGENPWSYLLAYHAAIAFFVVALRDPPWLLGPFATHLGKVSYGFYVFHLPILLLCLAQIDSAWFAVTVAFAATLALATAAHYALELPGIQLGRRVLGPR